MYTPMTEEKKVVEYRLIDDENMPPIVITMSEEDNVKIVINRHYAIWLSLHRKTIGGCAEPVYEKIDELLEAHLKEQRAYEKLDYGGE
jgi:hypothetical protein|tara:strand:- start:113 stop:376 length:264 start_codon:yes stop_codon:yes gene_type:complete